MTSSTSLIHGIDHDDRAEMPSLPSENKFKGPFRELELRDFFAPAGWQHKWSYPQLC